MTLFLTRVFHIYYMNDIRIDQGNGTLWNY
jgi:hypothetical protein